MSLQPVVLYQDSDYLVIDKPAGMVANRAEQVTSTTVQDWWQQQWSTWPDVRVDWIDQDWWQQGSVSEYGELLEVFSQRGGLVHRLDKDTSGTLLLAKHPVALAKGLWLFQQRQVQKTYLCLVHGQFTVLEDVINLPLGRSLERRTRFAVREDGRPAETSYQVISSYSNLQPTKVASVVSAELSLGKKMSLNQAINRYYQGFSLVKCQPTTGRTHQIRVHLQAIRHPIVSDPVYLDARRLQLDQLWCPRLFLHATELKFTHPRTKQSVQISAPLPQELAAAAAWLC